MGCAGPAADFRQRATLKVTGWDYLSVQEFDHQTNAFIPAARWSKKGTTKKSSRLGMKRGVGRIIWWEDVSLWAGRILGRTQRAAGGDCAQGAEGEDGGVVGVPGRGTTARQVPNLYGPCFPSAVLFQQHLLLHFLQVQTGSPWLPPVAVPKLL